MELTPEQGAVMQALAKLDPPATVKQIGEQVGLELKAPEIRLLVAGGLVQEVEVAAPPKCRFTLTTKGAKWVKEHQPVPPPEPAPAPQPESTESAEGRGRRMSPETKTRLWERFAAGEGATPESVTALSEAIGFSEKAIRYQRLVWEKAGRPGEAQAAAPAPQPDEPAGLVQEPVIDAAAPAPAIEQDPVQEEQPPQVAAFEASEETAPVEQESPANDTAGTAPAGQVTALELAMRKAGIIRGTVVSEPEPELPALEAEPVPVVGNVYEGQVDRVEMAAGGGFALVNLLEFHDKAAGKWIRGKVNAGQVLRRGFCTQVSDWLQPGDLVNVKVLALNEGPGRVITRWKVDLSIKKAPAHPRERIPLESDELPPEEAAPIAARGADVAAQLPPDDAESANHGYGLGPEAMRKAERDARQLLRAHGIDRCHTTEYALRILEHGLEQVTREMEADLAAMGAIKLTNRWAEAAGTGDGARARQVLDEAAAALMSENLGEEENERIAQDVAPALHDELLAAREEIEALRAALDAQRARANRMTQGLCASCVHRLDGFCPYPEMVAETYDLPEEDRSKQHVGRRIVFGRRPVVECELHRAGA